MLEYLQFTQDNPSTTVVCALITGYAVWYLTCVVKRPVVACNPRLKQFLFSHCPAVKRKFWPTFWCVEGRLQTVAGALIKTCPLVTYRKEFLCLPDGGHVALDWLDNDDDSRHTKQLRPTVIILPGLTGSSSEPYVIHLAQNVTKLGYRAVVFNYRGFGGAELKTPRTYCATNVDDLTRVIEHVKSYYPQAPVMATGVSLGGLILTNFVTRTGGDCPLQAAMSVSVPWDPFEATKCLEEPLNSILFNKMLTDCLINVFTKNAHWFKELVNEEEVLKSRTLRQFDDAFTVKLFGYTSYKEYYEDARLCNKVHQIKIPYLALNAADDMFSPDCAIPLEEANKSENVAIVKTEYGGHIGFLEGALPFRDSFIDQVFSQFVDAIMKHGKEYATS